jgi:hypothetical protein
LIGNCYVHAAITAETGDKVGGFVGWRENNGPMISGAYFKGSINRTGGAVGTFCGQNDGSSISGWAQIISNINPCGTGAHSVVSVAESNLRTLSAYTGLSGYVNQDGFTYPYLAAQSAPAVVDAPESNRVTGSLFNTASQVDILFGVRPIISVTPGSLTWSVNLPSQPQAGETVKALVYENGKTVSYPAVYESDLGTSIETVGAGDPVIAVRYYNLQGMEVSRPASNEVYIVKKIHASQRVEAIKVIERNR